MNILAFFAHPDDETMLCGGILALAARQGAKVHYLCATKGEGGEAGEPPLTAIEELGKVREAEMSCAISALGGASLAFLDYIDPRVGPENELYAFTEDRVNLITRLDEFIKQMQIDVLISHGSNGEYGHPAHRLTHQAADEAILALGERAPLFYTTQAAFDDHPKPHLMNPNDPADLIVDITPVLDVKTAAAMCHQTQHALFIRRASKEAGRQLSVPEVIVRLESLHRRFPETHGAVHDSFAELLRTTGQVRSP